MQLDIEGKDLDPKSALGMEDIQTLASGKFCDKSHAGKVP